MNAPGVLDLITTAPSIGGLSGNGSLVFGVASQSTNLTVNGGGSPLAAAFHRLLRVPPA